MVKLNFRFSKKFTVAVCFSFAVAVMVMAFQRFILNVHLSTVQIFTNLLMAALVSFVVVSYEKKIAFFFLLGLIFEAFLFYEKSYFVSFLAVSFLTYFGLIFLMKISGKMEMTDKEYLKINLVENVSQLDKDLKFICKNLKITKDLVIDILAVDNYGNPVAIGIDDYNNKFFYADVLKYYSWLNMNFENIRKTFKSVSINAKYKIKIYFISNNEENFKNMKVANGMLLKLFNYDYSDNKIIFKEFNYQSDNKQVRPVLKSAGNLAVSTLKILKKSRKKPETRLKQNYKVILSKEEINELLGENKTKIKH